MKTGTLKGMLLSLMLSAAVLPAGAFESRNATRAVGDVTLTCETPGNWTFRTAVTEQDGKEYLCVEMSAPEPAQPPVFTLSFALPQLGTHHLWNINGTARFPLKPEWASAARFKSSLASGMPLYAFINDGDGNRLTLACDEVSRELISVMGVKEEGCLLVWKTTWFTVPEAPMTAYRTTLCLDARDVFWADAVREASLWMREAAGCVAGPVPEAAYEPLYSTWYQYHQEVYDHELEKECALAASLGIKTLIVDDGWQTDNNLRGYAFCGDWRLSSRRFPDMPAHVKRIQRTGLKYMMWYSVPFVGRHSDAYARFKDCILFTQKDFYDAPGDFYAVLDPRFPEVREYLTGLYVKAVREWGLDGFKLDFIDSFRFGKDGDPALRDGYAGRDVKTVPEGVSLLMTGIRDTLSRLNPDVLIEFRQKYVGPAITRFGNMFRVSDCPGDAQQNRIGICNLRVGAPGVAVHSDMIEWHPEETPGEVARNIQSALFGVVQYSMVLAQLPEEHLEVVRCWLDFSRRHRGALLKGWFRPHHPEAGYPYVEAGDGTETVKAVYQDGLVVPAAVSALPETVINASAEDGVTADFKARSSRVRIYDCRGRLLQSKTFRSGLRRVDIPSGGWMEIINR